MSGNLLWKVAELLGRATYLGRPTSLRVGTEIARVTVSGDVATLRQTARVDKGLGTWFGPSRYLTVPLPRHLGPGVEVLCLDAGIDAQLRDVSQPNTVIDARVLLRAHDRKWRNGEAVEISIVVPCNTRALLDFPLGETGKRTVEGNRWTTEFQVRKKAAYSNWVIEDFEWRKRLETFRGLAGVSLIKNEQESVNQVVDIVETVSTTTVVADTMALFRGTEQEAGTPIRTTARSRELVARLSFEKPADRYRILLRGSLGHDGAR